MINEMGDLQQGHQSDTLVAQFDIQEIAQKNKMIQDRLRVSQLGDKDKEKLISDSLVRRTTVDNVMSRSTS